MEVEDSHTDTRGSLAKDEIEANVSTSLILHPFIHHRQSKSRDIGHLTATLHLHVPVAGNKLE